MAGNVFQFSEVEQKLVMIKRLGDQVQEALNGISNLIKEND